ncbi:GntR family transcriptional regulator [Amycolatopsis jejuensis]|uniref:GntR family transcriptional regulator n=1 Tax=Amycolatopsis jejuensis TaxID=330084 RepID=UPI00068DEDD1|nr:GntR family transcriptional regulator [Amycolatopsis jejuensis]
MTATYLADQLRLGSVTRESGLRQQVVEALRAAIISGRMRPGVVYPAPMIGEMMGISATPVREAMLDLAREGLVEVMRNKGFRITGVSEHELDELAETRLLLEVPTMRAVARRTDEETATALRELLPLTEELERAAETSELVTYMQMDTEFHTRFLLLHGNEQLVNVVRSLRNRSRLYGLERLAKAGRLIESTREHAQMVHLALDHDHRGLEKLTRRHIGHVRADWARTEG